MKLRNLFYVTFCLIALVPTTLFWAWPYSEALDAELKDVNERHLVIAKNLSAVFERYYQDVIGVFTIITPDEPSQTQAPAFKRLLSSYDFKLMAVADERGEIQRCLFNTQRGCSKFVPDEIFTLIQQTARENEVRISTVTEDRTTKSGPIFLVVKPHGDGFLFAYLSTDYIVKTGKKIAFGEKGHAAVVDQEGNVLAHPLDSWIAEKKNIAKISIIQNMLAGKTGVQQFYSPALKGNMIAGYTQVPDANWGVMVPQPVVELESKANAIDEMAIFVMLIGAGLALIVTIPASFYITNPIISLSKRIRRIESGHSSENLDDELSRYVPVEVQDLHRSFTDMMEKIEGNKKEISSLAYFDSLTGLPNRAYFRELAIKNMAEMLSAKQTGALIFIDFDGFKVVNDTFGHTVGDDLLRQFGQRLTEHFSINYSCDERLFYYEHTPAVIPSRQGGDEIVILMSDVTSQTDVAQRLSHLFESVFSEYQFDGGTTFTLTGSAGVALFPEHGTNYDAILKLADIAMYQAKSAGKNQIMFSKSYLEEIA